MFKFRIGLFSPARSLHIFAQFFHGLHSNFPWEWQCSRQFVAGKKGGHNLDFGLFNGKKLSKSQTREPDLPLLMTAYALGSRALLHQGCLFICTERENLESCWTAGHPVTCTRSHWRSTDSTRAGRRHLITYYCRYQSVRTGTRSSHTKPGRWLKSSQVALRFQ